MRAKISVGTHYAVNHMVGGLKFLFDFLNSTMVKQYLHFFEEEQFESLSRSTLFRILEVREASQ